MDNYLNSLFRLTDYEKDISNLLSMKTQTPSNAGVAFEMQALGFGGEVLDVAVRPSVSSVQVDKTDWANIIR